MIGKSVRFHIPRRRWSRMGARLIAGRDQFPCRKLYFLLAAMAWLIM
jgi:hypothetical protein